MRGPIIKIESKGEDSGLGHEMDGASRTDIAEPKLIALKCNVDDRGFLYQIFGNYDQDLSEVRRVYIVGNPTRGIIRGFHMHKKETKAYFVVSGSAKFIAARNRDTKETYVLSSRTPTVLIVPPGNYHGWMSLEDNTVVVGLSNRTLEQSLEDDFRFGPMIFGKEIWEVRNR